MKNHKLFYGSSYDRSLDVLLYMWPDIKNAYPDAELHVCYGWDTFDALRRTNPERMEWKKSVETLMQQDGIIHHGKVGQDELKKIRNMCGIWAYPTYFAEINCITALEAQRDGLVPVTMDSFALSETVQSGVKIKGDISKLEVQQEYQAALLDMMSDKVKWEKESKKAKKFAKAYYWRDIAKQWTPHFDTPVSEPFVSIITITIREGFWNIMADNIAKQTYKNIEWIIVDDHKDDRSEVANKYAKKYNLNIRYIRSDKGKGQYDRPYGIARANNTGWTNAKGELLVFLQDFILMPVDGVERLVDVYRHNPDALLAPTDIYYHCKEPNKENQEDWWDGKLDIVTDKSWTNIRNEHKGLRSTEIPFDYEMNYGAIPRSIIEELNGWWEFFDDGIEADNTEFALRALKAGYRILIDDTNVAVGLDMPVLDGDISNRTRNKNHPRYLWLRNHIDTMIIRDETKDASIHLPFTVPEEIANENADEWIVRNADKIVKTWA